MSHHRSVRPPALAPRVHGRGAGTAALATLLLGALPSLAQEPGSRADGLEALAFMAGCWRGPFGSGTSAGVLEEIYTRPSENLVLGLSRFLRDGRAVDFEFARIERDSAGAVFLTPYPRGRPSPDRFRLTSLGERGAVFEAPEHDYPKRILYRRGSGGRLHARIDGGPGDAEGREWTLSPAPCPGGETPPP